MGHRGVVHGLATRISGLRILDTATELARFHRPPASPGFAAAADVVVRALSDADVKATVYEYPADGETKTYGWTAPPGWSVRGGGLAQRSPCERVLADFAEVAQSVVVHSPGGRFEGEVVHLGVPADEAAYDAVDLEGRVALVCARASGAVRSAARRGAAGVVVYPDDERAAVSHDLVEYQSLFPRRDEIPDLVPAFSISRREADRLVRDLAKGPVALRGEVDAQFVDGRVEVVEASIGGARAGAPTVLFVAHLCHPRGSANDNASGAAALVEIARALRETPLPASARFLWMPEFYGSLPWAAAHREELRGTALVLNLDMVGASPEAIGEPLRISRIANHTPHFMNAVIETLAADVASEAASARGSSRPLHWRFDPPSGGSDHLVFASSPHRLPALMLGHDDPYWHTDLDTPDKLDPTRLKQAALLAASLGAFAVPEDDNLEWVWTQLFGFSARELVRAQELARELDPELAPRCLDLALEIEIERSQTLAGMGRNAQQDRLDALRAIRRHLGASAGGTNSRMADEPCPRRRVDGPLAFTITEAFTEEEKVFFKERFGARHRAPAEGLINHCDGSRTPLDIALFLSLDHGCVVSVEDVRRGIDLLRKAGYVG